MTVKYHNIWSFFPRIRMNNNFNGCFTLSSFYNVFKWTISVHLWKTSTQKKNLKTRHIDNIKLSTLPEAVCNRYLLFIYFNIVFRVSFGETFHSSIRCQIRVPYYNSIMKNYTRPIIKWCMCYDYWYNALLILMSSWNNIDVGFLFLCICWITNN